MVGFFLLPSIKTKMSYIFLSKKILCDHFLWFLDHRINARSDSDSFEWFKHNINFTLNGFPRRIEALRKLNWPFWMLICPSMLKSQQFVLFLCITRWYSVISFFSLIFRRAGIIGNTNQIGKKNVIARIIIIFRRFSIIWMEDRSHFLIFTLHLDHLFFVRVLKKDYKNSALIYPG